MKENACESRHISEQNRTELACVVLLCMIEDREEEFGGVRPNLTW